MTKRGKLMAAAIAAAAIGTPSAATAQENASAPVEMRVGVIDVTGDKITFGDRNTTIHYREFTGEGQRPARWITESGADHGQMVASAVARQVRLIDPDIRLRMFTANAFQENSGTGSALYNRENSKRTISVNWAGAKAALDWFHENGVKVVVTAFNSPDTPALRAFMQTADHHGMTVFASAGNKLGGAIYPAAYPQSISVAGDNRDLSFRKDPTIARWVDFVMDGAVPLEKSGRAIDEGSSFAAAKAGAIGAYYSARNPDAGRDDIEAAVRSMSTSRTYEVQGSTVTVSHLDDRTMDQAMKAAIVRSATAARSKGPASPDPSPSLQVGLLERTYHGPGR